jgi:putative membrane protein
MKRLFFHLFSGIALNAGITYLLGYLTLIQVSNTWVSYLIIGAVLGIMHTFIRPFLRTIALPLITLTFGIFSLVINGMLLWLTSYVLFILDFTGIYFTILSFEKFFLAILIYTGINVLLHQFFHSNA